MITIPITYEMSKVVKMIFILFSIHSLKCQLQFMSWNVAKNNENEINGETIRLKTDMNLIKMC
jgi:hypothetical protein